MKVDISQKKLYEKLVILEKYCIKLEKRLRELEDKLSLINVQSNDESTNTQTK